MRNAPHDVSLTPLELMVAHEIEREPNASAYDHPEFAAWLVRDAIARQSPEERAESERVAAAFTRRTRARIIAARIRDTLPIVPFRVRPPTVAIAGGVRETAMAASRAGYVGWVQDCAVAAGHGRELWESPCEAWLEIPSIQPARDALWLALQVTGDSMLPLLHPADILVVRVNGRAKAGTVVVAQQPGCGYVAKYVGRASRRTVHLESLNPEYPPVQVNNDPTHVLGPVTHIVRRDGT